MHDADVHERPWEVAVDGIGDAGVQILQARDPLLRDANLVGIDPWEVVILVLVTDRVGHVGQFDQGFRRGVWGVPEAIQRHCQDFLCSVCFDDVVIGPLIPLDGVVVAVRVEFFPDFFWRDLVSEFFQFYCLFLRRVSDVGANDGHRESQCFHVPLIWRFDFQGGVERDLDGRKQDGCEDGSDEERLPGCFVRSLHDKQQNHRD